MIKIPTLTSMEKHLLNFWSNTSTKIALAIALMTLAMIALFFFSVVESSRVSFIDVVSDLDFNPGDENYQSLPSAFFGGQNILFFGFEGERRPQPLHETFVDSLENSLYWIVLFGIAGSLAIGYFSTRLFSKPLDKLVAGIHNLRQNNYKETLDHTGTREFDVVIDEFNRLTEELHRVELLRKDLISDTSHELKTPITNLLGQLEAVRDGVLKLDENRTNKLINEVNRLDDLIDRLQEFSHLRSRNLKIERSVFNLRGLINQTIGNFQKQLDELKIQTHIHSRLDHSISADRDLLERVFVNLLQNTVIYSKAKNVYIEISHAEIIFKDDGIGVPSDQIPYLFERFYRVEKSRNRQTGGLGLGLAIVKEIVEAHGWKISAESKEGLEIHILF